MTITWDEVLKWVPVFTPALLAVIGYVLRRMLLAIHQLVNDRLDKALRRIDDLEQIVRRSASMTDTGSTAEALRSKDS